MLNMCSMFRNPMMDACSAINVNVKFSSLPLSQLSVPLRHDLQYNIDFGKPFLPCSAMLMVCARPGPVPRGLDDAASAEK